MELCKETIADDRPKYVRLAREAGRATPCAGVQGGSDRFDGTCEEALAFYSAIFDGNIVELMRFGDSPGAADMPPEQCQRVICEFRGTGCSLYGVRWR